MSIEFVKNTKPFLDDEIDLFFKNNTKSFNLDFENYDKNRVVPCFFEVFENGERIGLVSLDGSNLGEVEIVVGKLDKTKKDFLDKVLSNLDLLKQQFPQEWLDVDNEDEYKASWLAIVKADNPYFDFMCAKNIEYGFNERGGDKETELLFQKAI